MVTEISMTRDNHQQDQWETHSSQIKQAMADSGFYTVIELSRILKRRKHPLTPWIISKHLDSMKDAGLVVQEASKWRLIGPLDLISPKAVTQALGRIPHPTRVDIAFEMEGQHSVTIRREGGNTRLLEHYPGAATIEIQADED
jgi:hypothetical protein